MSRITAILPYIRILLTVVTIHVVVLTLLPGSLIVAIIPSLVVITVFLPSSNSQKSNDLNYQVKTTKREGIKIKNTPLTFENLVESLDLQALGDNETDESLDQVEFSHEELEIHSMLGNVFNTMANDANKKVARNKVINTNKILEKPARRIITRQNPGNISKRDINLEKEEEPLDIELRVDPDGKLHYIFQEKEEIGNANDKTKEKIMDKIDDPFNPNKVNRKRGSSSINKLEE